MTRPGRLQVRDWYVESFKDLRAFPRVDSQQSERQFTDLLKHIYSRHRNVVPVMAMGVAELKKELSEEVRPGSARTLTASSMTLRSAAAGLMARRSAGRRCCCVKPSCSSAHETCCCVQRVCSKSTQSFAALRRYAARQTLAFAPSTEEGCEGCAGRLE